MLFFRLLSARGDASPSCAARSMTGGTFPDEIVISRKKSFSGVRPDIPKTDTGPGGAGLLTRSRRTPSRPAGQWLRIVRRIAELTATGIVPDSHRSSLLIPMPAAAGREPRSGTNVAIILRKTGGIPPVFNEQFVNKAAEPPRKPAKNAIFVPV